MEGPKERLQKVMGALLKHVPAMFQIMLNTFYQVWLEKLTDEQVLELCREVKQAINYVESGHVEEAGQVVVM